MLYFIALGCRLRNYVNARTSWASLQPVTFKISQLGPVLISLSWLALSYGMAAIMTEVFLDWHVFRYVL